MKKGKIIGITVMVASLLTGCVDAMPDLTEEQSALIAEYAADMLLKYSPNYNYRIADEEALAEEETTEEMIEEATQEQSEVAQEEQTQESVNEMETVETENSLNVIDASEVDFAETFGVDGVEIRYDLLEVCNSYPKGESGSGFSVNAPEGKSLIVISFIVENKSEEPVICDLFEKDFDVSMNLNNSNYKKISSTLLVNDFTTYIEEIPAGENREVVIVAETGEISEEEINSCILRISSDDESITVKLK
ncbi:MAG: hypothetical protein MR531_08815 [Lachnospiraceae bacterium]|nr:hypothetical protein [Lachnospiraceae bacterium]